MKKDRGAKDNTKQKYSEAITLYADTCLSIKEICEKTGVGFSAFSSYLSKHHRELILQRHNLTNITNVKLRGKRGQTTAAHYKYKDAIAACDSQEYIEYNISQIARIFDVDCSSLASQLRRHYPEIVPRRESERRRMGITINLQYGVRKWSKEGYAKAVEMLQTSDKTIEEVAEACDVSYTGLREHILAYYPKITQDREEKRIQATGQKVRGMRNGNWTVYEPDQSTLAKYEEAIERLQNTDLPTAKVAAEFGLKPETFRMYLKEHYPALAAVRGMIKTSIGRTVSSRRP